MKLQSIKGGQCKKVGNKQVDKCTVTLDNETTMLKDFIAFGYDECIRPLFLCNADLITIINAYACIRNELKEALSNMDDNTRNIIDEYLKEVELGE